MAPSGPSLPSPLKAVLDFLNLLRLSLQIFPDPEQLQPRQSGELLIPSAQAGSEVVESVVDEELLAVAADDSHLSGRQSLVAVPPCPQFISSQN